MHIDNNREGQQHWPLIKMALIAEIGPNDG